jgi:hypothetical protein
MRFIPCLLLLNMPLCGMDKKVVPPLHVESVVVVRTTANSVVDQNSHCLVAESKQVVEVTLKIYRPGLVTKTVTFSIDV